MNELKPSAQKTQGIASDLAGRLRSLTPARVGLDRTGVSLATRDLLDFNRCHAMARDAVHAHMEGAALATTLSAIAGGKPLRLHSAATNRAEYLQRPDLGRRLNEASRALLAQQHTDKADLVLVIADGLSALAVEHHAAALVEELLPLLPKSKLAPICIVEQGRVAIGDEIGEVLGASIVVVLIGERPGLSSPHSVGAYVTWRPQAGRSDAERNCISNIRPEGLDYAPAAAQLAFILNVARRLQMTGVALGAEVRRLEAQKT